MDDYNEVLSQLIDGTNFEISIESQVLTSSKLKVKCPIEAINCILGGGLPLNGIYHTYGPPKGGKSTWLYQTMGNFQKAYPDGVSIILDMESSADPTRLQALGVDTSKVVRLPATSIESGFLALFKIIENKQNNKKLTDIPMFVIWDTISRGLAQDGSTQSRMNAQDRARIIKNYMPDLSARIEKQPFILGLINQVVYEVDRYGNRHTLAGGGIALQHDNHMSVLIENTSSETDSTGTLVIGKWSNLTIDKSKMCPEIKNIPFKIDITKGGYIDELESFVWFVINNLQLIKDAGMKWYVLEPIVTKYEGTPISDYLKNNYDKKFKYPKLIEAFKEDETLYDIFRYAFMDYISGMFSLQANIIKEYKDEVYSKIMKKLEIKDSTTDEEIVNEVESSEEVIQQVDDN